MIPDVVGIDFGGDKKGESAWRRWLSLQRCKPDLKLLRPKSAAKESLKARPEIRVFHGLHCYTEGVAYHKPRLTGSLAEGRLRFCRRPRWSGEEWSEL